MEVPRNVTALSDAARHGGLRTAVPRLLWLAGLLLGFWFFSWLLAGNAGAADLPVNVPVVGNAVQPVVAPVTKAVAKVLPVNKVVQHDIPDALAPVGKVVHDVGTGPVGDVVAPVGKVVRDLETGPLPDVLAPVGRIVKELPPPLPAVVAPVVPPAGSTPGSPVPVPVPGPGTVKPLPGKPSAGSVKTLPSGHIAQVPAVLAGGQAADVTVSTVRPARAEVRTVGPAKPGKTLTTGRKAASKHPARHSAVPQDPAAPAPSSSSPATASGSGGSVAAATFLDPVPAASEPGRLLRSQDVYTPLWRALKPGTSPG